MYGDDLTCQEFVELVTDYLENTLPLSEKNRFEAHMAQCSGCTNYLDQIRKTIRLTGALSEDNIPPAARDELLGIFRDWKKNPSQPSNDLSG